MESSRWFAIVISGSITCCGWEHTEAAGAGAAFPQRRVRAQAADANAYGRRPERRAARHARHGAAAGLAHRIHALHVLALSAADSRLLNVLQGFQHIRVSKAERASRSQQASDQQGSYQRIT